MSRRGRAMNEAAGRLWNSYLRGWSTGARVGALDPKLASVSDAELRSAYGAGYDDGLAAHNAAAQAAALRYGYDRAILPQERCGVEGCRLPPEHAGLHAFGGNTP